MGAWLANSSMGDWIVLLVFGGVGYLMKKGGVPRPPLVLGFVIGPIMEKRAVHHQFRARRPGVADAADLPGHRRPDRRHDRLRRPAPEVDASRECRGWRPREHGEYPPPGRGGPDDGAARGRAPPGRYALRAGADFFLADGCRQIPMLTFIPAIGLSLAALWHSVRDYRHARAAGRDIFPGRIEMREAGRLYLWWLCVLATTVLAGQLIALPLFAALYVTLRGRFFVVGRAALRGGGLVVSLRRVRPHRGGAVVPLAAFPLKPLVRGSGLQAGRVCSRALLSCRAGASPHYPGAPATSSATSNFTIFPMAFLGSSGTNRTMRGTCSRPGAPGRTP